MHREETKVSSSSTLTYAKLPSSIEICIKGVVWDLRCILRPYKHATFAEQITTANDLKIGKKADARQRVNKVKEDAGQMPRISSAGMIAPVSSCTKIKCKSLELE
ncbi:hypothetical protein ACFE04_022291 [Oxalis oulophora]